MKITIWNVLTIIALLAMICVAGFFLLLFINPQTPLNIFPPIRMPATVQIPTSTPTIIRMPATWTPTPTLPSETPRPSLTAIPSSTALVMPSYTPSRTPTKTPTKTPLYIRTSVLVRTYTNTPGATRTATKKPTRTPTEVIGTAQETTLGLPNNSWQNLTGDPAFIWAGRSGFAKYDVYWGKDADSTTRTAQTNAPNYDPPPVGSEGTFYLRVLPRNSSGTIVGGWKSIFVFRFDITLPNNPTKVKETVKGGASGVWHSYKPAFSWSGASDSGSGINGYYVYWGTDPAGTNLSNLRTSNTFTPSTLVSGKTYYLRILARDKAGNNAIDWLDAFEYKFDNTPPKNDANPAILDGSLGPADPIFSWVAGDDPCAGGCSGYKGFYRYFGISSTAGGTENLIPSGPGDPQTYNPHITKKGKYYLRVRSRDFAGNLSGWKTIYTYTYP